MFHTTNQTQYTHPTDRLDPEDCAPLLISNSRESSPPIRRVSDQRYEV